jgi:hypothetical protein
MSNSAPPKTQAKKKQPVVHKTKETGVKMPKAKAPVISSIEAPKTPAKSPKKAVVVEEVEEVVCRLHGKDQRSVGIIDCILTKV